MSNPDSLTSLISTVEAAKILGLQPRQTRQHAANGTIPATPVGRDWVFKRSDVIAAKGTLPPRGWPKGKKRVKV